MRIFILLVLFVSVSAAQQMQPVFEKHYRGTLDTKTKIYVKLIHKGDSVFGTYLNETTGDPMRLVGGFKRRVVELQEIAISRDGSEKPHGTIIFNVDAKELPERLNALWSSLDEKETKPIFASQTGYLLLRWPYIKRIHIPDTPDDSLTRATATASVLRGMIDTAVERKVNYMLMRLAYQQRAGGMMAVKKGIVDSLGWYDEHSYITEFMTDRLISATSFASVQKDPLNQYDTVSGVTIDLTTGLRLILGKCIKPTSLPAFFALAKKAMRECMQMKETDFAKFEIDKKIGDLAIFREFSVTPIGIQLSLTPFVPKSRQDCAVPMLEWKDIATMLIADGPLREFAK